MNFSFATLQASQAAAALVSRVNVQIQQAATVDEQVDIDQAPDQRGEVLLDQADSFIQLSYDPATSQPKSFAFQANKDLAGPDGNLLVPNGTQSSYLAAGDKETFSLQIPTPAGPIKQETVLNNSASMVLFSEGATPTSEFSFATLQAAQSTTALVQKLQIQIAQTAGFDEKAGVDGAASQPGQVLMKDAGSSVQLAVDPATSLPQTFAFKASQNLLAEDGTVVVAAGTETGYERKGDLETFRQDMPTDKGVVRQQAVLDNASQTVDFQEYILKA